jgi:hypothetical protein
MAQRRERWSLVRDTACIEHEPNASSGGQTSIEIGNFLAHGGHGPEHQALLRLIGSLVEEPERVATLSH